MDKNDMPEELDQEILDALKKGAVVIVSNSGEAALAPMDDLPPNVRECFRASAEHRSQCPDCLEDEAQCIQMDADSHREDGNVHDAKSLELEAAEFRLRAAMIRRGSNPFGSINPPHR